MIITEVKERELKNYKNIYSFGYCRMQDLELDDFIKTNVIYSKTYGWRGDLYYNFKKNIYVLDGYINPFYNNNIYKILLNNKSFKNLNIAILELITKIRYNYNYNDIIKYCDKDVYEIIISELKNVSEEFKTKYDKINKYFEDGKISELDKNNNIFKELSKELYF